MAFRGAIWDVRRDRVDLGEAGEVTREYIEHPGAVAVVALRQHQGRDELILIKQYRHPVKATEWELPAGLLDVAGEAPHRAAERELAEEVDLHADRWHHLTDVFPSPGGLGEAIRVYLARDLHDVPPEQRHQRDGEELGMPLAWIDLDDAVTAVLSGRLTNALAQLGVLATAAARDRHWQTLRPVDIPFHAHPAYRQDTE
ncbi:ADP-ribose pyrophosphatase [Austwickia sp. TVS 96-490-7B]|nr:ADP-ribose pyrophosphatase [Austwickia sp. TVS 96-490-7B]